MEEIILDFTMSDGDVPKLSSEQMLQRAALDKTLKLLLDAVKRAEFKKSEDTIFYNRSHNSILINGSRGTGKSTFIRFIIELLENGFKDTDFPIKDIESIRRIHPLKVIDPTLISSKENIVILIITLIKEDVKKHIKNTGAPDYKKWKESLGKLAGGLWNIDGVGANHLNDTQWSDKDYILEVGLERSNRGLNLERDFNSFLIESLNLLGKDCFAIVFDDVDTQFERGWPVLECIRKYLTSPQIIAIISGDLDLFSTLVRTEIRKSFQIKNSLLNGNQSAVIDAQIATLEEQYLLKIIKPENRVSIRTMWFEYSQTNSKICYNYEGGNKIKIDDAFDLFCKNNLKIHGKMTTIKIMQSILRLPLRSNISIAKQFEIFIDSKPVKNAHRREANESIVTGFSTALNKEGVNPDYIKDPDSYPLKVIKEKWKLIYNGTYNSKYFSIFENRYLEPLPLTFMLSKYSITDFHALSRVLYIDLFLEKIYERLDREHPVVKRSFSLINTNSELSRVFWELSIHAFYKNDNNRTFIRVPDNEYKWYSAAPKLLGTQEEKITLPAIKKYLNSVFELSDEQFEKSFQNQSNVVYASLSKWFRNLRILSKDRKLRNKLNFYNKLNDIAKVDPDSIHEFINLSKVKIIANKSSETYSFVALPILINSIFSVLEISKNEYGKFKVLLGEILRENKIITDPLDREYVDHSERKNPKDTARIVENVDEDDDLISDNSDEIGFHSTDRHEIFTRALYAWAQHSALNLASISIEEINHLMAKYLERVDDISQEPGKRFLYTGHLMYTHIINILNDSFLFTKTNRQEPVSNKLSFKTNLSSARVFYNNLMQSNQDSSEGEMNKPYSMFRALLACPLIGMYLPIACDKPGVKQNEGMDFVFNGHEIFLTSILEGCKDLELSFGAYKESLYIDLTTGEKLCFFEILNTVPYVNSGVTRSVNLFDTALKNAKAEDSAKQETPSSETELGDLVESSYSESEEYLSDIETAGQSAKPEDEHSQ
jgi:hypothetical protein